MAKTANMSARELDKYYGKEPTNIDVELNELEVAIIKRRVVPTIEKSRNAEAISTVFMKSKKIKPDPIVSCFEGIRYSIRNPPRYWGIAQDLVDDIRDMLKEKGMALSGGLRWIS